MKYYRDSTEQELEQLVLDAEWIVHLAGVNRPKNDGEFIEGNVSLTEKICDILRENKKKHQLYYLLLFRQKEIMSMAKANLVANKH